MRLSAADLTSDQIKKIASDQLENVADEIHDGAYEMYADIIAAAEWLVPMEKAFNSDLVAAYMVYGSHSTEAEAVDDILDWFHDVVEPREEREEC